MKKMLSILMSLLLLWSLALPAAAAETAATLRLEKTEGTVSVSNASGKSVTVTKGMRLYSGYTISTEKDSYAYVSLDSTKAVKLDASSKAEVQKSGKKLELTATAGKLFFNVSAPVDKDESLNIRTSTMVTGVRGTSGWVEVTNRFTSRVHLLEGTLTVTSSEPATGQMRQATITSGQTATATLKGLDQAGRQMTLTVTNLQEKQVPGFVAVEVEKNPALQQKIAAKSPLSVPAIIGDAWARLENEQASANAANQKIQQDLNKIAADDVDQVFQSPVEDDDDDDDEPYVPPTEPETPPTEPETPPTEPETPPTEPGTPPTEPETPTSITLDDPSADALTEVLGQSGVDEIIVNAGTRSTDAAIGLGTASYEVPAGQTLTLASGTFTVGAGRTLTVNGTFNNSGTVNVEGTMDINSNTTNTNSGIITILSSTSLHIAGSLTNSGTIEVGSIIADGIPMPGKLVIEADGTLTNTGTIRINPAYVDGVRESKLVNSGTFNNSGSFGTQDNSNVISADLFTNSNSYIENRDGLYAMAKNGDGRVYYLGPAAQMDGWYADTTVTLLGKKKSQGVDGTLPGGTVTASNVTLDLNGRTAELNESLFIGEQGSDATPSLTITDSSPEKAGVLTTPVVDETQQGFDTIVVYSGNLTLNEGKISSTKGFPIHVSGGTVSISGGTVTSSIGTAIQAESGSVTVSGGAVDGYNYGIQNTGQATVNIFGSAVITATGDEIQALPVSGNAAFGNADGNDNNVVLRAKDSGILYKMFSGTRSGPDSDGYYSVTSPTPGG